MKFGVKVGMVGLIEECCVGIDFLKEYFSYIYIEREGMFLKVCSWFY